METSLKSISASYSGAKNLCLDDISFSVAENGVTALLGESGSGKTSILRLFAGFLQASRGEVKIDGTTVASAAAKFFVQAEKRRVGVLFQDYALFPHLNVADNILFGVPKQLGKSERQEILDSLLEACNLSQFNLLNRRPHELSGGQTQRVALARVLASRPRLLILDEPFSSVDLELRERMLAHIKLLIKQYKMRLLYITHDKNEAFQIADHLAIIQHGQLLQQGSPLELYQHPVNTYVAKYFDKANILSALPGADKLWKSPVGPIELVDSKARVKKSCQFLLRPHELFFIDPKDKIRGGLARVLESRYFGSYWETLCLSQEPDFKDTPLSVRTMGSFAPQTKGELVRIGPSSAEQNFHILLD